MGMERYLKATQLLDFENPGLARFVAKLLIVSLLTLNIAWTADECAFTSPGEPSDLSLKADNQPPVDPTNTGLDCDDWCHGWSNPVALPGAIVSDSYTPAVINGGSCTLSYSSLPIPPPSHPPIV